MVYRLIAAIMLAAVAVIPAAADRRSDPMKPRWMTSSLPSPCSPGYIFLSAQGVGSTLEEARQRALFNLSTKLEHERGLEVTSRLEAPQRGFP